MSERQQHLHEVFLKGAMEFGLSTDERVAVVLPVPGFENSVVGDLKDEANSPIQKFYAEHIREQLPGLLVTRAPIDTRRGLHGAIFFSFESVDHPFREAKRLVEKIASEPESSAFITFLSRLNEFVMLRPNFGGVGIDLNALIRSYIEKSSKK